MVREWALRLPKWIRHHLRMPGAKTPETIVEKSTAIVAKEWALKLPKWIRCHLYPFYIRMAGGLDPWYYRQIACHCRCWHRAMQCEYVVCSSTRPRRPTVVIRRRQFLLSWSPLRDVICKFRALTHGALSLTFVVIIHHHCCYRCHRAMWCKCLGRSLWGYRHWRMLLSMP